VNVLLGHIASLASGPVVADRVVWLIGLLVKQKQLNRSGGPSEPCIRWECRSPKVMGN